MILSQKHKFIFIKGKKVAGTSLEVLLSDVCGQEDIITPITPIDERDRLLNGVNAAQNYGEDKNEHNKYLSRLKQDSPELMCHETIPVGKYYNHMPLHEVETYYGKTPNDWTIFAVERCPYRKIISFANMQLNFEEYQRNGLAMVSDINALKTHLDKVIGDRSILNVKNRDLYKDSSGKIAAEILHFENLEEDITKLMENLNINTYPKLKHFKKGICSNSLNLLDIFSKKHIQIINELFVDEFNCFGYEMIE